MTDPDRSLALSPVRALVKGLTEPDGLPRLHRALEAMHIARGGLSGTFVPYHYLLNALKEKGSSSSGPGGPPGLVLTNGIFAGPGLTPMQSVQLALAHRPGWGTVVLVASDAVAEQIAGGPVDPLWSRLVSVCAAVLQVFVVEWDELTIDRAVSDLKPGSWIPGEDWPNAATQVHPDDHPERRTRGWKTEKPPVRGSLPSMDTAKYDIREQQRRREILAGTPVFRPSDYAVTPTAAALDEIDDIIESAGVGDSS